METLSRRQFLHRSAGLVGFGCCACAGPITGQPVTTQRAAPAEAGQAYDGPIIDCHSHVGGRHGYDEDTLLRVMDQAGVGRVVAFGSSPAKAVHERVIPVAYVGEGRGAVFGEDLGAQLKDGAFRGLKMSVRHFPFPMQPGGTNGSATDPLVRSAAALAAETRRPVTLHLDGPRTDDLAALCREFRDAPIIWAHAGTTPPRFGGGATPGQVREMLDAHPNLHIDVSARAPGWMGPISFAEWEGVFLAHPGRTLYGVDVFLGRFFPLVGGAVIHWRELLGRLPRPVAEQVAYKNAERLFLG